MKEKKKMTTIWISEENKKSWKNSSPRRITLTTSLFKDYRKVIK